MGYTNKMQILASKFIYLSDQGNLEKTLEPFKNTAIQLSFFQKHDFLQTDHKHVKEICTSFNISIPTVHAPTVDVFNRDFLEIMKTIRSIYGINLITVHPQKGDSVLAMSKLEEYARIIEDLGVTLAYENFPSSVGRRKWVCLPKKMHSKFNLPFLKLTFDTSHLDNPAECIDEFDVVADKVAVIHLSDNDGKSQHQPLGTGNVPYKQFLRYLKDMDFSGPVVIEYMPEYEAELMADVNKLIAI